MILDTPTKSLRIVLGEAKGTLDCDIVSCWGATTPTGFVPAANDLVSNGTTAVTVVAAPGAGEQRQVNEVRLFNNDTITHNVTLQFDNGGTIRVVEAAPVPAGSEFLYTPSSTNAGNTAGSEWNAGTVTTVGSDLSLVSGTLDVRTIVATSLFGNAATISAKPSAVAIGTGLSLSTAGTLTASGSGGTVTQVNTSGAGISGGPITTTGTITVEWNAGTVSAINSSQLALSGATLQFTTGPTIQATNSSAPVFITNGLTALPAAVQASNELVIANTGSSGSSVLLVSVGTVAPQYYGASAGGTAEIPVGVTANMSLLSFSGIGFDGTSWSGVQAQYNLRAAEIWNSTSHGTLHRWSGTPTGSTTLAEWMRIANRHLLIGGTVDNGTDFLQVTGSSTQTQVQRSVVAAAAGYVGEYISQSVASGSAVTLTSGSVAAIGSIVISGTGDFDIYGMIALTGTTTTTVTKAQASINTTGTVLGTTLGLFSNMNFGGVALGGEDLSLNIIGARVTAAGTYFLNTNVTFAIGNLNAYGIIEARRR